MLNKKLTIKTKKSSSDSYTVEMDAKKLEKLAASMGFFSDDFLESLDKSEKDYKKGRVKKLNNRRVLG